MSCSHGASSPRTCGGDRRALHAAHREISVMSGLGPAGPSPGSELRPRAALQARRRRERARGRRAELRHWTMQPTKSGAAVGQVAVTVSGLLQGQSANRRAKSWCSIMTSGAPASMRGGQKAVIGNAASPARLSRKVNSKVTVSSHPRRPPGRFETGGPM